MTDLSALLARQPKGRPLLQEFYRDPRDASEKMLKRVVRARRSTLGGDKNYDAGPPT